MAIGRPVASSAWRIGPPAGNKLRTYAVDRLYAAQRIRSRHKRHDFTPVAPSNVPTVWVPELKLIRSRETNNG